MSGVLLEARPFRPFKSSEEYLYAMKEDLAEWLNMMYSELDISVDDFMEKLETGVALCKHANSVRKSAEEYVARKQLRKMTSSASMTTSVLTRRALPITEMNEIHYKLSAKPGTFFARDNVSNFIDFCRKGLEIIECLLFETDDLIMRKNEKHVILCLLEVARRGAKFGMLAPILVQMEREIDREIAAEQRLARGEHEIIDEDEEDEDDDVEYGPVPQIITNDLKSLDEMVRDLVEKCTCPTQFPMIRVSEGKYRIGDTKVLIFVRILRSHVMVRVGGGWDTLSHYLDKHDPCRCRTSHRAAVSTKLMVKNTGGIELNHAQVFYERSPPRTRRSSASSTSSGHGKDYLTTTSTSPIHEHQRPTRSRSPTPKPNNNSPKHYVSTLHFDPRARQRSPSPSSRGGRRSRSPGLHTPIVASRNRSRSPGLRPARSYDQPTASSRNRSRSPSVRTTNDHVEKTKTNETAAEDKHDSGSEVSDEGYRSLGIIGNNNKDHQEEGGETPERPSSECGSTLSTNDGDNVLVNNDDDKSTIKDSSLSGSCNELNRRTSRSSSQTSSPVRSCSQTSSPARKVRSSSNTTSPVRHRSSPTTRNNNNNNTSQPGSPARTSRSSSQTSSPSKKLNSYRLYVEDYPTRSRSVCSGDDTATTTTTMTPTLPKKNMRKTTTGSVGKLNTWNGKVKSRPALQTDTFTRNTARTGSFGAGTTSTYDPTTGRRVQQQPNKQISPLVDEILKSKNLNDDRSVLMKMKEIIDQYSDMLVDDGKDDFTTNWVRNNGAINIKDDIAVPNRRKDCKYDGNVSKIPAPVFYKQPISEKEC